MAMQENALLLFELSTGLETETRSARLRCRHDHVFAGEIPRAINIEQSPALLEEITQEGCAVCLCPNCGEPVRVAEPIVIHDAKSARAAVFLPAELGHRELDIRASWALAVARCDVEKLPSYYEDCCVLVGRRALEKWQIGLETSPPKRPRFLQRKKEKAASKATDSETFEDAEKTIRTPHDSPPGSNQGIHEAFADLARREVPVKAEPDLSGYNEPEAQFDDDDDWLNDAMIEANSRMGSAPPPRASKEKTPEPLEPDEDLPTLSSFDEPEEAPTEVDSALETDDSAEEIEEINENDISIIVSDSEQKRESRPTTPLPVGVDAPSSRSTCGVESGKVVLGRCAPVEAVRWFSKNPGDLLVHFHLVDEVPVVTLCLVGGDYRDFEKGGRVLWFLDVASDAHREVLRTLGSGFVAEVRLFSENLEDVAQFQVKAPREKNAKRIWERVEKLGDKNRSAEELGAARAHAERDLDSGVLEPPFEESRLARPVGLGECVQRLSFLAQWLAEDAYEELIFVRSYPLAKFENAIAQTLEVALELGARIPPILRERALKQSGLSDLMTLARRQAERLMSSSSNEKIEAGELARMWVNHLIDAQALDAALNQKILEHAREQISKAGKDPDEEIAVAFESLMNSTALPKTEENAPGSLDEPVDT